ncbi:hypothetical protein B0H66DRAFT_600181 [Apodospora peruviana]|uniref:Uncharacterized protein n=1 Tax=Apodospora peruviana TaxID=516989 RepID=A0AAE0IKJ0_9PEZI|nr:hypothetical protein B0H66DRAFT_600181 [Apodospora peruviana]
MDMSSNHLLPEPGGANHEHEPPLAYPNGGQTVEQVSEADGTPSPTEITVPGAEDEATDENGEQAVDQDEMLLGLQAPFVREPIAKQLEEFEKCVDEILQKTIVLFWVKGKVTQPETITRAAKKLEQASNAILEYLEFMKGKTGLDSGGDPALEADAKYGLFWAHHIENVFALRYMKLDGPHKALGLDIKTDVKARGGSQIYRRPNGLWATLRTAHPLLQVPGTPWHKFFANIINEKDARSMIPDKGPRHEGFKVITTSTSSFIRRAFQKSYSAYREIYIDASNGIIQDEDDLFEDGFGEAETNLLALAYEVLGYMPRDEPPHGPPRRFYPESENLKTHEIRQDSFNDKNWKATQVDNIVASGNERNSYHTFNRVKMHIAEHAHKERDNIKHLKETGEYDDIVANPGNYFEYWEEYE